jgi:ribosome maturation protein SDO1
LEPRHPTNAPEESKLIQQQHQQPAKPQQQSEPKAFKCSMCPDASFDTNAEFRLHYKSDWHNFNLKLKNKGIPTMSNEEYLETILAD